MVRLPFWSVELVFRLLLSGKGRRTQFAPMGKGREVFIICNYMLFLQADFLVRFIGNVKIKNHLSNLGIMLYLQA